MTNNYIQKFLKSGKRSEQEFANMFSSTISSTPNQDMSEHWDIQINHKFDVKGLRKIRRSDPDVNEFIHWIEIKNVHGMVSWLYSLEVDYFAFETKKYWVIVEKKKLQDFIKENVDKEYVEEPQLYKLYQRKGRKDVLTMVETMDLIYISEALLKKNN